MLSVRDPIRRRQPVERPLDIVGLELLVSVSQALLAGLLLSLAAQLGGDARSYGLPVPGLLAVLGVAVGLGWLRWLMGGSGWAMASVCLATSILAGALWLLALQDPTLPRVDPAVGLIAVACAMYGLVAGVFLDGPHRAHWKGGVSEPHRGLPQTRAKPARFSPPVQKVVDERLTDLRLPHVSLPSAARVAMPRVRRTGGSTPVAPLPPTADGLAPAAEVVPHPSAPVESASLAAPLEALDEAAVGTGAMVADPDATQLVERTVEADATQIVAAADLPTSDDPAADVVAPSADATGPADPAPTAAADAVSDPAAPGPDDPAVPAGADAASDPAAPAALADPDAPTQPVARPAPEWPRPIEPRGHTGSHRTDPGS